MSCFLPSFSFWKNVSGSQIFWPGERTICDRESLWKRRRSSTHSSRKVKCMLYSILTSSTFEILLEKNQQLSWKRWISISSTDHCNEAICRCFWVPSCLEGSNSIRYRLSSLLHPPCPPTTSHARSLAKTFSRIVFYVLSKATMYHISYFKSAAKAQCYQNLFRFCALFFIL